MSAEELRKKYPEFVYESFRYFREGGGLAMAFRFKIEPDIVFNPKIKIHGVDWGRVERLPLGTLENLAFHIGLAEMPSYWKCTVSPRIVIKAGKLTGAQIRWWKNLIMNGLAEFFYVNRIAPTKNFLNIKSDSGKAFSCVPCVEEKNRKILLPVGGGKYSLVAIELLKTLGEGFGTMVLGNVPASFNLIKACGAPTPVKISRKIDKKLLELNRKGYLNGHTPFSSCLAFLGTCCAEIFWYGYVAVAN